MKAAPSFVYGYYPLQRLRSIKENYKEVFKIVKKLIDYALLCVPVNLNDLKTLTLSIKRSQDIIKVTLIP